MHKTPLTEAFPFNDKLVELQADALEKCSYAAMITDRDGLVVWANPAFEQLTGYAENEIVGQTTRVLKSGRNAPGLYDEMWEAILGGKVWRGLVVNRRKDGTFYDEEMTITPLRNGAGEITHFFALKQDVTERKLAEERISLLSQALEDSSEFIGMADVSMQIIFANQSWLRALGYSQEELIGQSLFLANSANNPAVLIEEMRSRTFNKGGWTGELLHRRKDGSDLPVQLNTGLLKDRDGNVAGVYGIGRDISERKRAEQEILFKNLLLEAQAETTIDGILAMDQENKVILSNSQFASLWAVPSALMRGANGNRIFEHVANQVEAQEEYREKVRYLNERRREKSEDEIRLKDGRVFDRYSSPLVGADGQFWGRIWYFRDVTQQIKAKERMLLWSRVLSQTNEAIFICDSQERILLVNRAFEEITGFTADETIGQTPRILYSGIQDEASHEAIWKEVQGTGKWIGEIWSRTKAGERYIGWLSITAIRDSNSLVTHYVGIFSDITAHKQDQSRLEHLAHYDPLTDLPNRTLLMDRLNQLIKSAKRRESMLAVVFLDLDRFKEVNDSLGHDVGDRLLQTFAKRILKAVREEDTVSRIGGDEFIIVLQAIRDEKDVANLAQRLLSCFADPVTLGGYELTVTGSLGISIYPQDGNSAQDMIRNADAAMYEAKSMGRNAYQFYTGDLNRRALEMLSMENALRRAIDAQQFVLHYQPQIDIRSGAIIGAEALIRWNHPEQGLVMPGKFIPVAEERGLIVPLGAWVIEEAARQAGIWQKSSQTALPIAVNVSAVQFRQKNFVQQLSDVVQRHGIPPNRIELELTESIVMRDVETVVGILKELHNLGFRLSIDDFGTGYSSLRYLRQFAIDKIKIDQSFVADLARSESAKSIVTAIISLAHSMRLSVIAEGVQAKEQLKILREQQCGEAQGFLFSPGIPAMGFESFVRDWRPGEI